MISSFAKKTWFVFFKEHPFYYSKKVIAFTGKGIGNAFSKQIFASFMKKRNGETVSEIFLKPKTVKGYALQTAINKEINALPAEEKTALSREIFWGNSAGLTWHLSRINLYSSSEQIYQEKYLLPRRHLIEAIQKNSSSVEKIIEIGSGNGILLFHLYDSFFAKSDKKIIGIELNKDIIGVVNSKLGNRKIEFICTDLLSYTRNNQLDNSLIFSTGTLEMLLQNELEEVLSELRKFSNVIIVLCEPVEKNYADSNMSQYRGNATFYSHNYRYLLEKHNFSVIYEQRPEFKQQGDNLLTLVAR